MSDPTKELIFQNEVVAQMVAGGWKRGNAAQYDRALALYPEDVIGFVQATQPEQWEKFCGLYPANPEQKFLERVTEQLDKADPNAADRTMRTFGTLGVLRHELRDRGTRFSLCQFKPEHDLNPDTLARYGKNRLRIVPELVYSQWATDAELATNGAKAKAWRIDLVLFVNGLPVATLELKSEFKQAAEVVAGHRGAVVDLAVFAFRCGPRRPAIRLVKDVAVLTAVQRRVGRFVLLSARRGI